MAADTFPLSIAKIKLTDFEDYDLWYGLVFNPLFDKDKSVFWQYSQNHILQGYSGNEKLIDMNIFMGSKEEFEVYPEKKIRKYIWRGETIEVL